MASDEERREQLELLSIQREEALGWVDNDIRLYSETWESIEKRYKEIVKQSMATVMAVLPQSSGDETQPNFSMDTRSSAYMLKLMKACEKEAADFYGTAQTLASSYCKVITPSSLKKRQRIVEKTRLKYDNDYSLVKDILRCSLVCDDPSAVASTCTRIKDVFTVLRGKNRFAWSHESVKRNGGYRDILVNVKLRSGIIAEIQVHLAGFYNVKNMHQEGSVAGHAAYARFRDEIERIDFRMKQLRVYMFV